MFSYILSVARFYQLNRLEPNRVRGWVSIRACTATSIDLLCIPMQLSHHEPCTLNKLQ